MGDCSLSQKMPAAVRCDKSVFLVGAVRGDAACLEAALERHGTSLRRFAASQKCLAAFGANACDLLIVSMANDPEGGLALLMWSKEIRPSMQALALVHEGDVRLAVWAIQAGAVDCIETPFKDGALRSALTGLLRPGSPERRGIELGLTRTERLVLAHILEGKVNYRIADILRHSPRTIEVHCQAIIHKLGVSNTINLLRRADKLAQVLPRPPSVRNGFAPFLGT